MPYLLVASRQPSFRSLDIHMIHCLLSTPPPELGLLAQLLST